MQAEMLLTCWATQRILRSAPWKTAQTCCALATATGMTVAVWTAGTLEAYFFTLVLRPPQTWEKLTAAGDH